MESDRTSRRFKIPDFSADIKRKRPSICGNQQLPETTLSPCMAGAQNMEVSLKTFGSRLGANGEPSGETPASRLAILRLGHYDFPGIWIHDRAQVFISERNRRLPFDRGKQQDEQG
jgi:hypothetical protein